MKAPSNGALKAVTIAAMLWTIEGIAFAQGPDGSRPSVQRGMADAGDWQGGPPPAFRGGPQMDGPGMAGPGGPEGRGPGGGPGGRGPGGPGGRLTVVEIPAKALAVMLGLSAEQTEKIDAVQKAGRPQRPPMRRTDDADRGGPPHPSGPPNPGERMARGGDRRKQTKAAILAVLTDPQKALLTRVTDEAEALRAARIPLQALPDLGLSAEQQKKIAAIGMEGRQKAAALLTSDSEDMDTPPQESLRDAEEAMGDDVRALLTSDQRAKARAARKQFRPGPPQDGTPPPFGREQGGRRGPGGPGFDGAQEGFDGPPPPMDGGQGGPPRQARGLGGRSGGPGAPGFGGGPEMDGPGMQDGGPGGPPPPDAAGAF